MENQAKKTILALTLATMLSATGCSKIIPVATNSVKVDKASLGSELEQIYKSSWENGICDEDYENIRRIFNDLPIIRSEETTITDYENFQNFLDYKFQRNSEERYYYNRDFSDETYENYAIYFEEGSIANSKLAKLYNDYKLVLDGNLDAQKYFTDAFKLIINSEKEGFTKGEQLAITLQVEQVYFDYFNFVNVVLIPESELFPEKGEGKYVSLTGGIAILQQSKESAKEYFSEQYPQITSELGIVR